MRKDFVKASDVGMRHRSDRLLDEAGLNIPDLNLIQDKDDSRKLNEFQSKSAFALSGLI